MLFREKVFACDVVESNLKIFELLIYATHDQTFIMYTIFMLLGEGYFTIHNLLINSVTVSISMLVQSAGIV